MRTSLYFQPVASLVAIGGHVYPSLPLALLETIGGKVSLLSLSLRSNKLLDMAVHPSLSLRSRQLVDLALLLSLSLRSR